MYALVPLIAALFVFASVPAYSAAPMPDPSLNGPPIKFFAKLSADEEVPPADSAGSGLAEFSLNRADLKLTWKVAFKGLVSPPTTIYIHGPERPGGKAPMVIDLASHGIKSPMEGSLVLDENQLQYFVTGRVYVNIHTAKFQDGEIRGQIERGAPR